MGLGDAVYYYLHLCKVSQVMCLNIYGVNCCWSCLLQSCYYLFTLRARHRNQFHINSCLSCMKVCVIDTTLETCLLKVFWRIDLEKIVSVGIGLNATEFCCCSSYFITYWLHYFFQVYLVVMIASGLFANASDEILTCLLL